MLAINRKNVSFSRKTFWPLLVSSIVTALAGVVIELSDEIVVGSLVSENALIAVSIVLPIYLFDLFLSGLIVVGSSLQFSREIGKMNKKHASEIFGQAVILLAAIGIIYFTVCVLFKDVYLDYLGISQEVRIEVNEYWHYYKYGLLVLPIQYLFELIVYEDGDNVCASLGSIVLMVTRISLSIILGINLGVKGVGLAAVLSGSAQILVYCTHFFKKSNNLHFRWYLSWKEIRKIVALSLVDSIASLCLSLMSMTLNKFVISVFSEEYIPIAVVCFAVCQITIVLDAIGKALTPMGEVYLGEKNFLAEHDLYIFSFGVSLVIGVLLQILVILFSPLILKIYGIVDPETIELARTCIIIMSFVNPFLSLNFLISSQGLIIRKIPISVFIIVAGDFVFPMTCGLLFGYLFSFVHIWIGFVIGGALSTIAGAIIYKKCANKDTLIKEIQGDRQILNKSFIVKEENIKEVQNTIINFLDNFDVPDNELNKIDLLIEEYILTVVQNNPNKEVIGECSIVYSQDAVNMYLRDSGKLIDWSDEDIKITGLSSYVFTRLTSSVDNIRYVVTSNYNRILFRFSKQD